MQQVLFTIPIKFWIWQDGLHVYGYGVMLLLAFIACTWFLVQRATRERIDKDRIYDAAFWVFLCGIIGARIVFMIQYRMPLEDFYRFWEGGLVFYGSAIGGWVGYGLYWLFVLRKHPISTWRLADIVAPTACLGLAIGRVGCLLNGCCYGHVCLTPHGITFPTLTAPARELVVNKDGYQTLAGFSIADQNLLRKDMVARVGAVEPGSPAARAGLQSGDLIVKANGQAIEDLSRLEMLLQRDWPRGEKNMSLTVLRNGTESALPAFVPRTLRLHPTQLYETVSMILLFFLLLALFPFRLHYGMLFPVLMWCYAIHRFLNESLRDDTEPVLGTLTLSQVISIGVFLGGIVLELYLWRFAERITGAPPPVQAEAKS